MIWQIEEQKIKLPLSKDCGFYLKNQQLASYEMLEQSQKKHIEIQYLPDAAGPIRAV